MELEVEPESSLEKETGAQSPVCLSTWPITQHAAQTPPVYGDERTNGLKSGCYIFTKPHFLFLPDTQLKHFPASFAAGWGQVMSSGQGMWAGVTWTTCGFGLRKPPA